MMLGRDELLVVNQRMVLLEGWELTLQVQEKLSYPRAPYHPWVFHHWEM